MSLTSPGLSPNPSAKSAMIQPLLTILCTVSSPPHADPQLIRDNLLFCGCTACRILVPQPGIKSRPLAVKMWSPIHWTTMEFPIWGILFSSSKHTCYQTHMLLSFLSNYCDSCGDSPYFDNPGGSPQCPPSSTYTNCVLLRNILHSDSS